MIGDTSFTREDLVDGCYVVPGTRIVEFVVEDGEGRLVLPSMRYDGADTTIDLSGFAVEGTWHLRRVAVDSPEPDAELLRLFMERAPARPFSATWSGLEQHYYASGQEQYSGGQVRQVLIPATGAGRQTFRAEVRGYGAAAYEPTYYNFQIYSANTVLADIYAENSTLALPENLPYAAGVARPQYAWRVRHTDRTPSQQGGTEYLWSEFTPLMPFVVNVPPTAPTELAVGV